MAVSGTVLTPEGDPVEGVLVMGADLNYSETDASGRFALSRPEMAVFFWCTGFRPVVRPIVAGESCMHVVLQRSAAMRASA